MLDPVPTTLCLHWHKQPEHLKIGRMFIGWEDIFAKAVVVWMQSSVFRELDCPDWSLIFLIECFLYTTFLFLFAFSCKFTFVLPPKHRPYDSTLVWFHHICLPMARLNHITQVFTWFSAAVFVYVKRVPAFQNCTGVNTFKLHHVIYL